MRSIRILNVANIPLSKDDEKDHPHEENLELNKAFLPFGMHNAVSQQMGGEHLQECCAPFLCVPGHALRQKREIKLNVG